MKAAHRIRATIFRAEPLEPRLLLASISGVVYNDVNADAARNPFIDPGLGGWTVYVDGNENGVFDGSEFNAASAPGGAWSITSAAFRTRETYHVRIVNQAGWRPTEPAPGEYAVSFSTASDTVTGLDFGQTRRALVTGTVFLDVNEDGTWDREPVQPGRTVFADANDNGILDGGEVSAVTDSGGDYALSPAAGTYTIRQVQLAGWWQTFPSPPSAGHPVTLSTGQSLAARRFGNVVATIDLFGAGFGVTSPFDPVPADGRIDVLYQVRNNGTADSPAFRVDFYLSHDDNITTADTLLRSIAQGSVPRHSTADRTTVLALPTPDPFRSDNQYYVGMIIDSDADVVETDETNNSNRGVLADHYPVSSEADLPVPIDNVNVSARPLVLGVMAESALADEWIGAYDADVYRFSGVAGHRLRVDFSGPAALDLFDASWTEVPIQRDEIADESFVILPATGAYFVVASGNPTAFNPRQLAGRSAGSSIVRNYSFTITNRTTDLVPADLAAVIGVDRAALDYTLRNDGRTSAAFDLKFFLSDDPNLGLSDFLLDTVRINTLAPGSHDFQLDVPLPSPDPYRTDNQYWIIVVADPGGTVLEANEQNNTLGLAIRSERIRSPADGTPPNGGTPLPIDVPVPGAIGDEWIGPYDLDIFIHLQDRVNERLRFDVDTVGSPLDSYLRLYDDSWTLLAANDNGAAPGEAPGTESFLEHLFIRAGTYWLVIGSRGNHTSDPTVLAGRTAAGIGSYTLTATFEPTGPLSGLVYNDADGDGTRDPGEVGVPGRSVYIDGNDDGIYDPLFEAGAQTDASGGFSIGGVRTGTYRLRQVLPAGWARTAPRPDAHVATAGSGQPAGPFVFGTIQLATVAGTVFEDSDADGTRDDGERALTDQVVFADLNHNGIRDVVTVTLDAPGTPADLRTRVDLPFEVLDYAMLRLVDVDVRLRATAPAGADQIDVSGAQLARHRGPSVVILGLALGYSAFDFTIDDEAPPGPPTPTARRAPIESLTAFDGSAPNGIWILTVRRLPSNLDATVDEWSLIFTLSEPFARTASSGAYAIADLFPGDHQLRVESTQDESDWIATSPAGGVHSLELVSGQDRLATDFGRRRRRLQVSGRHVFYNNSAFDGRDPAINASDDDAVALDKSALLSGGSPSPASITSYVRGINGVMIDVHELLTPPTLADFSFKVQSLFNPGVWGDGPAPTGFAVRSLGAPDPTARRLTFTWPDGLLKNLWVQVGVLANATTRRPAPDIAYFGNLIGEGGDALSSIRVSAFDVAATRAGIGGARVTVQNRLDHNRDGWVNVRDVEISRSNLGRALPQLVFPQAGVAPAAVRPVDRAAPLRRAAWGSTLLDESAGA